MLSRGSRLAAGPRRPPPVHAESMDSVADMNAFAKRKGAMTLRTATGERTLTLAEARAVSRAREEQAEVRPPCPKVQWTAN